MMGWFRQLNVHEYMQMHLFLLLLIILDHSDEEGARRAIDEIKEKSCHELIYDHVEKKHVILNFGMAYDADFDGSDESIKKLYYEADQNMYHDKKINLK